MNCTECIYRLWSFDENLAGNFEGRDLCCNESSPLYKAQVTERNLCDLNERIAQYEIPKS